LPLVPFVGHVLSPLKSQLPSLFPDRMLFVTVSVPLLKTPPPTPPAAELSVKMLFVMVTVVSLLMKTAPPALPSTAELPENVLMLIATVPP